jgi:hypothetical protein
MREVSQLSAWMSALKVRPSVHTLKVTNEDGAEVAPNNGYCRARVVRAKL